MPVNKPRRRGSYAPLSAHYYKDDAVADAGEAAELLYVRGLAFCADVLSDGYISERQLSRFVGVGMRDVNKRAARLVEVGLWERAVGGYRVAAWLKWNRSRDDITDLNRKDADRKTNHPSSDDDRPDPPEPEPSSEDDEQSGQIPFGIQTESEPAQRKNPDGIQPRVGARAPATPLHSTPTHSKRTSADADPEITAASVVASWAEEITKNGEAKPSQQMRAQVGKEAKRLLGDGTDPHLVLAAARQVGSRGYATLNREVIAMQGRRSQPRIASGGALPLGYNTEMGSVQDPKTGRFIER